MAHLRESETTASNVAKHSTLCPALASGLGEVYSELPNRLILPSADDEDGSINSWHRLEIEDGDDVPELRQFLDLLGFTNAVCQIAHPLVLSELLDYIFHG
jgi:hypothetical protein